MNFIKKLFCYIFKIPLVWTIDFDGVIRLRKVYFTPFNQCVVRGIFDSKAILLPNGCFLKNYSFPLYLEKWTFANKFAEHLFCNNFNDTLEERL